MMTKVLFQELSTSPVTSFPADEIAEIKEMTFKQRSGRGFVTDLDQDMHDGTIEKIKCPTLLLHSNHDNAVSIEMAHFANEVIEKSSLITYDNKWGHLLGLAKKVRSLLKIYCISLVSQKTNIP